MDTSVEKEETSVQLRNQGRIGGFAENSLANEGMDGFVQQNDTATLARLGMDLDETSADCFDSAF